MPAIGTAAVATAAHATKSSGGARLGTEAAAAAAANVGMIVVYMNINGAYEFWKDIKVGFLHYMDGAHPLIYLP